MMRRPNFRKAVRLNRVAGRMFGQAFNPGGEAARAKVERAEAERKKAPNVAPASPPPRGEA